MSIVDRPLPARYNQGKKNREEVKDKPPPMRFTLCKKVPKPKVVYQPNKNMRDL